MDKDWTILPPLSDEVIDEWLAAGGNIGVATGHGFIVIDIDGPEIPAEFPQTLTVRTGRGWHLYYAYPGDVVLRNSAGKLGPKIDVRGTGGQVVIPPSRHATGSLYTWFNDLPMLPLPQWIRDACGLPGKWIEVDWARSTPQASRWGAVALARECAKVAGTAEGGRNDQLFRSAAALFEIVNGGNLRAEEVEEGLRAAASACGLPDQEVEGALRSARKRTEGKARVPSPRPAAPTGTHSAPAHVPDALPATVATVLVPGSHVTSDGEYLEITPNEFATTLLACQPARTIFHRGGVAGVVRLGVFAPLTPAGMRMALDAKPYKWITPKPTIEKPTPTPTKVYVPLAKEHAELAIARAVDHPNVLGVRLCTFSPAFLPGGGMTEPGWNTGGIYQTGPDLPPGEEADLRDVLIDFPWKSEADRQNFIGLLITILVRPLIDGNVPMGLILSTVERTGKTKLVDDLIGALFLGGPVPAMQFTGSDEERDKRILSTLMLGSTIVHLDNLGENLESAALASTITAAVYSGRRLGASEIVSIPNLAVWIGTGNNVAMSGELAKRTMPIHLLPPDADPHLRTEFVHPDFRVYVRENRDAILRTLVGMVRRWFAAGCPAGSMRIGGFEDHSRIVGGIMQHAGYTQWMANYAAWTGAADVEGADMIRFFEDWQVTWQGGPRKTTDLRKRASELGLFERRLGRASSERGQDTAFASLLRRYLKRAVLTSYGKFAVVEGFSQGCRMYSMERK